MNIGDRLNCRRCGHQWFGRSNKRPVQCPRCKSPAWDRAPKVSEAKVKYKPVSKTGSSARTKGAIERDKQDIDFTKLASFGMWKDLTETDEELLNRLGGGWGSPGDLEPSDDE